jgi:hypothetical protein
MHVNAYWIQKKYKTCLQISTACLKLHIVTFHVQKNKSRNKQKLAIKTQKLKETKKKKQENTGKGRIRHCYWYHLNIKKKTNCMH